jgi:dihydrofolate reductase
MKAVSFRVIHQEPAVSNLGSQSVFSNAQYICQVKCDVLNCFTVVGPAGVQFMISHFAAIDRENELAKTADRAMVIGGGSVYKQLLPHCDIAYITKVHTVTPCDTYFPNLDEDPDWYLAETLMSGEEDGVAYEMLLYRRK